MFFIFNKQKICSYLIAASTVVILFILSIFFINPNIEVMETTASVGMQMPIHSVDTEKKRISLSINCEWEAEDIDQILDVLKKNNIKTTFFVLGEWAEKYPDKVKKMLENGHEVANHSDKHLSITDLSYEQMQEEILNCAKKIKKITGTETKLYRAPNGEYSDTLMQVASDNGYKVIHWTVDSLDYQGLDSSQMWDRINKGLKNGSIILLHNGTDNTANSLETIIKNIQAKGYNIVKLSDLIYDENYEITVDGVQKLKTNNE